MLRGGTCFLPAGSISWSQVAEIHRLQFAPQVSAGTKDKATKKDKKTKKEKRTKKEKKDRTARTAAGSGSGSKRPRGSA